MSFVVCCCGELSIYNVFIVLIFNIKNLVSVVIILFLKCGLFFFVDVFNFLGCLGIYGLFFGWIRISNLLICIGVFNCIEWDLEFFFFSLWSIILVVFVFIWILKFILLWFSGIKKLLVGILGSWFEVVSVLFWFIIKSVWFVSNGNL